ncbi:hypothetical protein [Nonomuraea rubra]|uniref:Uncharacterized protein n=1 Tax=Nonomuraea rubra TaxID=46180 RepID=A0A7X0P674_9ACTN|nr:hypothetical protein [Nonomuraea rubra]MBB6556017.1 hypothetical protein [Nonomuraea rubra]
MPSEDPADTNFEPSFALEPGLWAVLEHALEVVERDVRARGITGTLRLITPDWDDRGEAWVEFQGCYHGNGIPPSTGPALDRVGCLGGFAVEHGAEIGQNPTGTERRAQRWR